jgi:hypothetical protein
MCNIPMYFCNIDIKYLRHTSEILEHTFATCAFSANISLLLHQIKARRHVEATGVLVGGAELDSGGRAAVAQMAGGWRVELTGLLVVPRCSY